ncbi:MAG TPA: hypothetical protein PK250_12665 [Syntrophobacter fumaroxidans]|nr:hypothetical protein [Syntrophobacter fumaroxidans]
MGKKPSRAKLKGKGLLSRLTGISTPVGGLSWTPPVDEFDIARKLLIFLEDRRALYYPYNIQTVHHVVHSVLAIRQRLTEDLEKVSREDVLGESLSALRASCRKFLTAIGGDATRIHTSAVDRSFSEALGGLRAIFGLHIARIACAYDLQIEEDLKAILPAEPSVPI